MEYKKKDPRGNVIKGVTALWPARVATRMMCQPQLRNRSTASANNANNQKGTGSGQRPTCYECEVHGHFKRECPKLKNNNNWGNQVGGGNAPAKVYAVGMRETRTPTSDGYVPCYTTAMLCLI
ncbi:putative reverse transcriptase domain-containing protein [Tanacetum coccineum]|uniref:Reverse transcriptase domain-containing protein n=1 Tax=Tanacetum coccineum TaxID=301880 RepID=A0ABQ5GNU3_9ASTR